MIKVAEVMTTQLITLRESDSVAAARDIMTEGHIRHIPAINERNELVGVVSQRDILRSGISTLTPDHQRKQTLLERSVRIGDIMTKNVACVHPEDSLRAAGLILQKNRYGCLPVVDGGKLVGIVTDTDFVGIAINLIEQQDLGEEAVDDEFE